MQKLPLTFKTYFPESLTGANVSLSYWHEPSDEAVAKQKGGVGLFVSLAGPDDFMGERTAKFMWDSLREGYFDAEGDNVVSLRQAVHAAQDRLKELIKNEEVLSEQGVDLNLCAFSISSGQITFSVIGDPEFILLRGDRIINIRDMLPTYDGVGYKSDIPVGNFGLQKDDKFLISTPKLVESLVDVFGDEEKKEVFSDWNRVCKELSLFSDNMAGNQYFWVIGNDVKEIPENDLVEEKVDESKKGGKKKIVSGADKEAIVSSSLKDSPFAKITKGNIKDRAAGLVSGVKTKVPELADKVKNSAKIDKIKRWWKENPKVLNFRRNLQSKVTSFKIGGKSPGKIFVKKPSTGLVDKKNRAKLLVIIGGVIVFIVGGVIIYWRYKENTRNELIENDISLVETDLSEASAKWSTTKKTSEVTPVLDKVFAGIAELKKEKLSDEQKNVVDNIEKQANELNDDIRLIVPLSEDSGNIEILVDTYLKINESADIRDIFKYGEYIYMVDYSSHALYRYKISGGAVEKVSNSQDILKEPEAVAVDDNYIFVYDKKVGIVSLDKQADASNWKFSTMPELSARSIGEIDEIGVFGGNIYLLKKDTSNVMKSFPVGAGFSYPIEYFNHTSITDATDMLIDGNIYILSETGERLYKFYGGAPDTFKLSNLDEPLGKTCCGYTNLYGEKPVYVFDKDIKRIVVIEKGTTGKHPGVGVMTAQFRYRGSRDDIFNDVKEIIADKDDKYMYVLDGTRILKVSLEHD